MKPNNITEKAYKQCAEWLVYCLSIGWSRASLDKLESLWWEHHDRFSNLRNKI